MTNTTHGEGLKGLLHFFAYDPQGDGFTFHTTLESARDAAQSALDHEQDNACDGWSEDVEAIAFGRILGQVVETDRKPWNEHLREQGEEPLENPPFDEFVDYKMKEHD